MHEKPDGCPRCASRGNAPRTWDDTTGCGTYTCRSCGHSWATTWQVPGVRPGAVEPADFGSIIADLTGTDQ